ncbi:sensor histidine kinase [Inhella sp.]|uniref:sensor histidine kinase n=1 Tax=Inhella sp. TaxID=1921806 RepID=UPI0035B1BD65
MPIRIALGLAIFESLVLAGVLWAWAGRVAGGRLLAAFLCGIALWMAGNELPNWFGPEVGPVAFKLMSLAPAISALFFHFCAVFCRLALPPAAVALAYALGVGGSLLAWLSEPAALVWREHVGWLAVVKTPGLIASAAWVLLGSAGLVVLLQGLLRAQAPVRQQILAVAASSLWSLFCLAGYGIALADLPLYPWPLLGLPLYPLILVYGVLRYGVFAANTWAGRALVWTLLLGIGLGVVALMPLLLPFDSRWLNGLAVAAACLALVGPVRGFVQRLIYPGGTVSAEDLAGWRRELAGAESLEALAARAAALLSQRLAMPVALRLDPSQPEPTGQPWLDGQRSAQGWQLTLKGWEAAPPGPRHLAEIFGSLVAEAAAQVERAQQLAAREREQQLQARLAELGALAATVAHDIRNPLNIISMAVALAPAETRQEVGTQVERIAHLTRDLLDYAKPWKLQRERSEPATLLQALAPRWPKLVLGPGLAAAPTLDWDPRRVEQALTNLLDNAHALAERVEIDAEWDEQNLRLRICDDGPGVPADLGERVFEPFASRSPGGTGLGLAIVARILAAHGGSARLGQQPGWRTCFELSFPR